MPSLCYSKISFCFYTGKCFKINVCSKQRFSTPYIIYKGKKYIMIDLMIKAQTIKRLPLFTQRQPF